MPLTEALKMMMSNILTSGGLKEMSYHYLLNLIIIKTETWNHLMPQIILYLNQISKYDF